VPRLYCGARAKYQDSLQPTSQSTSEVSCTLRTDGAGASEGEPDGRAKVVHEHPGPDWWDLRRRAQQAPPLRVDADYIQSVLGVQEGHAKNLISPLTAIGLIGEDGKLTPLGEDWRHDETYSGACATILEKVYPDTLRSAFPPPSPDRAGVEKWFARNAHVGTGAAGKMATTYLLVAAANPSAMSAPKAEDMPKKATAAKGTTAHASRTIAGKAGPDSGRPASTEAAGASSSNGGRERASGPSLHVDVQVHISPDASSEQIDAIFASMAKHLYPEQ
jgi:hypothetical protein